MIIGIDPGQKGALCAICPTDKGTPFLNSLIKIPTLIKGIDIRATVDWFRDQIGDAKEINQDMLVVIEKVHSMPAQGVASSFSFGTTYGQLQGVCAGLMLPFILVTPQQWKKTVLVGYDWKGNKGMAVQYVKQRFPAWSLRPTERSRKDSIDIAESVCIALYGLTIAGTEVQG